MSKKLVIGECDWLKENKHLPDVARVWAKKIAECEAADRAREAKKLKERLRKNVSDQLNDPTKPKDKGRDPGTHP